jgi:hypothetical protein
MLSNKSNMDPTQAPVSKSRRLAGVVMRKAATLAVVTVVFGWFYSWALPWAYPPNRAAGFGYGMLHGALMPLSLPSLVIARDVQMYDDDNTGRLYKIGYICGVDLCGIAFIGPLFWRPRKITSASSGKSQ